MRKENVLFVDDEPQIRRMMRTILTACGFDVIDTWSRKVLERFRAAKYDLVLLDINMSTAGMSGIETCRAIRAESDVAIVVLTTLKDEMYMMEAFEAGADDYVIKPFCTQELLARIDDTLNRKDRTYASHPVHLRLVNIAADFEARKARDAAKVAGTRLAVTR